MRITRWGSRRTFLKEGSVSLGKRWFGLIAVVVFAAMAVATTTASAGPANGLCSMDTSRGSVPADFAIDACIDGGAIYLRNNLKVPMQFGVSGDTGTPTAIHTDLGPAADATRALYGNPLLLVPGDEVRIPFGANAASVTLENTDVGGAYAIATTLFNFLPAGALYQIGTAATDLIRDLNDNIANFSNCITGTSNALKQLRCLLSFEGSNVVAFAHAGLRAGLRGAAAIFLDELDFAKWANGQPSSIAKILGSHRTISVAAAPQSGGGGGGSSNGPAVTVSAGAATTISTCTSSDCGFVDVSLSGFGSGSHSIACSSDDPFDATSPWYTYTTTSTSSAVCVYGYTGYHVWVTVDGTYTSNKLLWGGPSSGTGVAA